MIKVSPIKPRIGGDKKVAQNAKMLQNAKETWNQWQEPVAKLPKKPGTSGNLLAILGEENEYNNR